MPTTPELNAEIRERLNSLQPLRRPLERISEDTIIATTAALLPEAVLHYASYVPPLAQLPHFLLLDCASEKEIPEKTAEVVLRRTLQILYAHELENVSPQRLCIYARPQAHYWLPHGYQDTAYELHSRGITEYAVDASVTSALSSPPALPMLPDFYAQEICRAYTALADEESRETFLRVIKSWATGNPAYMRMSSYPQYKHPLARVANGDCIIEGGLENGLTTTSFAEQTGPAGRVIGFEAFPEFAEKSSEYCRPYPWVEVVNLGLWSEKKKFFMVQAESPGGTHLQSHIAPDSVEVQAVDLDGYLAGERCDLLKLDIEGAELECLKGALNTLTRYLPKLQISIYHTPAHLVDILLFLLKHCPGYSFFIGHHSPGFIDTCLYAIKKQSSHKLTSPLPHTDDSLLQEQAMRLAGKTVLFIGAGSAYRHYKNVFHACTPAALVVDKEYIAEATLAGCDVPVLDFASVPQEMRHLPLVLFARADYMIFLLQKVINMFPGCNMGNIVKCTLY